MIMIRNIDMIARYVVRLQDKPDRPPTTLSPEDCSTLARVLDDIERLPQMTPAIEREHFLKDRLRLVSGNSENLNIVHPYRFPDPFPDRARAIYNRYDAMNWGERPQQAGPPSPSTNHPVFGDSGIMRGILIKADSKRKSYFIREDYPKRDPNVLGNNGLLVGDWWPFQICALRDGAHGSLMSGIAGTMDTYAFSIVISGKYADLDIDRGDVILYSDSKAKENTNAKRPNVSGSTEAMRRSHRLGKPLRVLRSAGLDSKWAPAVGLRYDGLYMITDVETKHNTLGGAYYRFRLEREQGQQPIDRYRPNMDEKYYYERIERGY